MVDLRGDWYLCSFCSKALINCHTFFFFFFFGLLFYLVDILSMRSRLFPVCKRSRLYFSFATASRSFSSPRRICDCIIIESLNSRWRETLTDSELGDQRCRCGRDWDCRRWRTSLRKQRHSLASEVDQTNLFVSYYFLFLKRGSWRAEEMSRYSFPNSGQEQWGRKSYQWRQRLNNTIQSK